MHGDELINYHDRRPFRPFAIHLSDGRSFKVHHPEFMARSPNVSVLIYWHSATRWESVDSEQVTSLEQLPAKPNGRRKKK